MKILYDSKGFDAPYSGVSFYLTELVKHLPDGILADIAVAETNNPQLTKPPFNFPLTKFNLKKYSGKVNFKFKSVLYRWIVRLMPGIIPVMEMKNEKFFKGKLSKTDFDVLHLTGAHYYGHSWRKVVGKKPIVITVHDLIPELWWNNADVIKQRRAVLSAATHIISISTRTKEDLMSYYSVPSEKISVVYHGWTEWESENTVPVFPGKKYILYVGLRTESKNFRFFLKAIAPYLFSHQELQVVCTGKPFDKEEIEFIDELKLTGRVSAQFIPNEQMYSLYKNAEVFVFPSRHEGFGIPILDAFHAGCPMVLSNCTCFPEIGGDAATYFDDGDADGLVAGIDRVINDAEYRKAMIEKGLKRADAFTWSIAAEKTVQAYKKAIDAFNHKA